MKSFTDATTSGLDRWRKDLAYRNELVRIVALNLVQAGSSHVESGIVWFKNFVGYLEMGPTDRLLVRKNVSFIRRIVSQWHRLSEVEQRRFVDGGILPSALYRLLSSLEALAV
jgi:hypothetical protein